MLDSPQRAGRRWRTRALRLSCLGVAAAVAVGGPTLIAAPASAELAKVDYVCHRTTSDANPYTKITVATSGALAGHDREDEGPIYDPTLKARHIEWGDIIPPYTHEGIDYPGQNYGALGQAVYALDCDFPQPTVGVSKTSDADGDGTYSDGEVAETAGTAVPFRAVITNTSLFEVTITSLTDVFAGTPAFGICDSLIGTTLAAGASVTCSFTVAGYSPAAGGTKTNTVAVEVARTGAPKDTATANDDTTVRTAVPPPPAALSVTVAKTSDANGDTTFTDGEAAAAAGQDVAFQAVLTNTSTVPVVIASITDAYPGTPAFGVCESLVGTTLAAGASVTCSFTMAGYSPPAGDTKTNTVVAVVSRPGTPTDTATNSDTTTISTPAVVVPPPALSVTVAKTSDANGDGSFNDGEVAATPGQAVPFQVVVNNTSSVPVVIDTLTDEYPGTPAFGICADLVGTTVPAGGTVTCSFTLPAYSPAAGGSKTNEVVTVVSRPGTPGDVATGRDVTTVTTPDADVEVVVPPEQPVPPVTPVPPAAPVPPVVPNAVAPPAEVEALPVTGTESAHLMALSAWLLLIGAGLVLSGRRRPTRRLAV